MSDLISRADAMSKCKNAENELTDEAERKGVRVARFIIGELPSAEAVQGKWLPIEETIPTYDGGEKTWLTGMKCSNCGKLFDLRVGYYFCPSCGARMKGGGE